MLFQDFSEKIAGWQRIPRTRKKNGDRASDAIRSDSRENDRRLAISVTIEKTSFVPFGAAIGVERGTRTPKKEPRPFIRLDLLAATV